MGTRVRTYVPLICPPVGRIRRWLMPVRVKIHSSDVSTTLSRSVFLMTPAGAAEPTPIGFDCVRVSWYG